MLNYGFVVLNYINYQDTIACVHSIIRASCHHDYHVVVVDNASPNSSLEIIGREFAAHSNVTLVNAGENLGYSGGNNVGIRKLLEMGASNIVIATNDTEIISNNLLEEFEKANSKDVGIIGTDVITPMGEHQNPTAHKISFLYFLNLYYYKPAAWARTLLYKWFPSAERKRRALVARENERLRQGSELTPRSVYMLHGCFLCLTRSYLEKVGLLDDHLFMYGEEDLMSWQCELQGLKRIYLPQVQILHKDAMATKSMHGSGTDEFVRMMKTRSNQYLVAKIRKWQLLMLLLRGVEK